MDARLRGRFLVGLFGGAFAVLFLLWLPQASYYPPWNDTSWYALLGESFWTKGEFGVLGVLKSKQLPLQAILSYPLVRLAGYKIGMALSTLLAGFAVLIVSFFLIRRAFGERVAILSFLVLLFHHGFVLMTVQGSADLLFSALALLSIYGFLRAEDDERWYLCAGIAAGLACLTRYNGAPLFVLYPLWTLWKRRAHLRSAWFWSGMIGGGFLFSLWLLRNFLTFGDPLASDYWGEIEDNSPGLLTQIARNVLYYGNPLRNVLPFFLLTALYGLRVLRRSHLFLVAAMLALWAVAAIWFVQGMRFAFPGYPILLGFGVFGLIDLLRRAGRYGGILTVCAALIIVPMHAAALCVYTYGQCNAWFDRTVGILPANMGLSPEGLYQWDRARRVLNEKAEPGATVVLDAPWHVAVWRELFRSDVRLTFEKAVDHDRDCPLYRIDQSPRGKEVVHRTQDEPVTYVTVEHCL